MSLKINIHIQTKRNYLSNFLALFILLSTIPVIQVVGNSNGSRLKVILSCTIKFSKYSTYEVHRDSVFKWFSNKERKNCKIHNIRLQTVYKLGVFYLHKSSIFANLYFITETCRVGFYDRKNNMRVHTFWKTMSYLCNEYFIFLNSLS